MRGVGRRLAVAGIAAVVLAAVLVQASEVPAGDGFDRDRDPGAAVVSAVSPGGDLALVTRGRAAFDGDPVSVTRFSKTELSSVALGLGSTSLGWGWWYLLRPDRRLASPPRRASGAALRAPPRLVVP
jgi:hypothetical protein